MKALATKDSSRVARPHRPQPTRRTILGEGEKVQRAGLRSILDSGNLQAKLVIGQPNDSYEQEADRVADHVVAGRPAPGISTIPSAASLARKPDEQAAQPPGDGQAEEQKERNEEPGLYLLQPSMAAGVADGEDDEQPVQGKLIQREAKEDGEEPVQAKLIQRESKEDVEEPVQTRLIQREAKQDDEEPVQAKQTAPSQSATSEAVLSRGGGSLMRPDVRGRLEAGMGTDLSEVRVHEGAGAAAAAKSIQARAFTHKNDIWLGEGESQSDLHLMAHETTHVLQQGGVARRKPDGISRAGPRVQRLSLGDIGSGIAGAVASVGSAVANAASSAAEAVGNAVGNVIGFIKDQALGVVQAIPGYSLFTVVLGKDPITDRTVDRNGRNFIEAGLDVIPGGESLKRKLEEEGKLAEAAAWLDEQINALDISPAEIARQLGAFWSSLGANDLVHPGDALNRLLDIVRGPIERIVRFASTVGAKLLQIVKDAVISSLIDFIKEQTTAYPLLTVILGHDPISGEAVERTPIALLRGFMLLSESGAEQLRQMEESGSLQRAAEWLDGAVARLNLSMEELVNGFLSIWNSIGIESLLDPRGVFRQIYNTFAAPVGRIINFVIEVGTKVLEFIKDALISRLVAYARTIRGYPLLTVLLGRDPFSDEAVERSTENIIHGFMCLMDGGEEQFQEMKQTGAIARMTARIENAIATLNFTWEYIKGLFVTAWESFSLADLAAPIAAFQRLMGIFLAPLSRLISFVGEVIQIVIEVILKLMNFPVALVTNIIAKAMQAFEDIKRDPIGFLKNLLRAVKTGFQKFFDNILTHLLNGVTGWLFKELQDAGISPPTDLSFRSILGFVLDVLGISVDKIFQKLAEKIGQEKVDRIRRVIDRLTGIWSFVSDVMTRGPVAIWEYIKDQLSNLWNVVLDAVRNWVVTRIIQRITAKLLSMLDPTGIMAVVNGFIAFYNAIQSFIAYLREMLEIVNSFVEGVAEIARGSVERAANFLEGALARGVPVVIGFLANQVGLSGLGRRIGEMIERVRALVDRALGWLIDKALSAGTSFMNMVTGGGGQGGETQSGVPATPGAEGEENVDGMSIEAVLAMPPTPEPRDAEQKRLDLEHAGTLLRRIEQHAETTADIAGYFPRLQRRFGLREIGFDHMGQDSSSVKLRVNPEKEEDYAKPLIWKDDPAEGATANETDVDFSGVKVLPGLGSVGNKMTARKLGPNHPMGTMTTNSSIRDVMSKLPSASGATTEGYVAGHLLNYQLGGSGTDPRNLFPITGYANSRHSSEVESKVKEWVNTNRYWVYYQVEVKSDSVSTSSGGTSVDADFDCIAYPLTMAGKEARGRISKVIHSQFNARAIHGEGAYKEQAVTDHPASDQGHPAPEADPRYASSSFVPNTVAISSGSGRGSSISVRLKSGKGLDDIRSIQGIGEGTANAIYSKLASGSATQRDLYNVAGFASGKYQLLKNNGLVEEG